MSEAYGYKPVYLDGESIARLASLMHATPQAASGHYAVIWAAGFGSCVEDVNGPIGERPNEPVVR